MNAKTIFEPDTNVLISNPAFFDDFQGLVAISMIVVEELDKLKNSSDSSVAAASRHVSKAIDSAFEQAEEILVAPHATLVPIGKCMVIFPSIDMQTMQDCEDQTGLDMSINDNKIVATAIVLSDACPDEEGMYHGYVSHIHDTLEDLGVSYQKVVLLSNDLNVRIKARARGIESMPYNENMKMDVKSVFEPSRVFVDVEAEDIDLIQSGQSRDMSKYGEFIPNEYVILQGVQTSAETRDGSAIARAITPTMLVDAAYSKQKKVYGIVPRDSQQHFALDALMNPAILGVSMIGPAGTGKTLLALAAGLDQVLEKRRYKKVMVAKAPIPAGKDVGFLPGTLREKLEPWMGPVFDNLDILHAQAASNMKGKMGAEVLENMGHLEFVSTSFIRGRSISDTFIVIDEAQNLSIDEIKLILTRVNANCKIVLCGDPEQIDTRGLTRYTNGLTLATQAMRSNAEAQKIYASVVLTKSQRSVLAKLAAQIL